MYIVCVMCIQIFTHPICIVYMYVCFFLFVATGIGRGRQTTDVISIKRRHPNMRARKNTERRRMLFGDKNRFFFFYPKKHKNPPRQIFVSGLTLNGFFS